MATTTPNYGWDVPTSSDYVKLGAVAIETLGDDIDASLFSITSGKNVGMVHIATTSFTTASSVIFNNVFTSAFDNYVIKMKHTSSNTGSVVSMRLRVGGVDDSSSNYRYWGYNILSTSGVTSYGNNSTSVFVGSVTSASPVYAQHEIASPALAENTTGSTLVSRLDGSNRMDFYGLGNIHTVNTAYDGFSMIAPSGQTITGTIRIYGLRNS
jgi:hypothetical protein